MLVTCHLAACDHAGAACTAAFVYYATALFVRLRGPDGMGWGDASATNLVAFGMSDITPARPHRSKKDTMSWRSLVARGLAFNGSSAHIGGLEAALSTDSLVSITDGRCIALFPSTRRYDRARTT